MAHRYIDRGFERSKAIWSDIRSGTWIDRNLPPPYRPYARLMRLDRPIGTWLLLLPCWWSVALAGGEFPDIGLMILFAIGAVVMRGAGCVINDIYDRKLDALVERTSVRPLASGEIKLWQAFIFLVILLTVGFGILLCFNRATIITGATSLVLVAAYPLMKRITWWPQLFLGFTFNWGALVGWTAKTGTLSFSAFLLYTAGIFWTLGYDTIYAHQDKFDDEVVGIKSTALLLGNQSRSWMFGFYALFLVLVMIAGAVNHLGQGFYVGIICAAALIIYHLARWDMDDPTDCLRRFSANRDIGLVVLAALVVGKWL